MAHTPGPWYVGKYGDNDADVCAEGGPVICAMRGGAAEPTDPTSDDDAALIAAAPDLLDALLSFVELDADGSLHIDGSPATEDPVITAAKRAIAKAEGRHHADT
jgi:hypothetical protein